MANNKFVVLFAGSIGSSKTPIAYYLSWNFNLPVFNNDAIRTEVMEDFGGFDEEKYLQRRNKRLNQLLNKGNSFIYDASLDRIWGELKPKLEKAGYQYFIISINLSKLFLNNLYQIKVYTETLKSIDNFFNDHQKFLKDYSGDINLNISEDDFPDRLEIAKKALEKWLQKL